MASAALQEFLSRLSGKPLDHRITDIAKQHAKQAQFITSGAAHVAFVGGRGSGKTYGGCFRALLAAYGYIGDSRIETPNLGMITAPTYALLNDGSLRAFMDIAKPYVLKAGGNAMRLRNGSEILWRSMDNPDTAVRGPSVSWWWGDEAAQYRNDARNLAVAMLRQFGKRGYEWLTTTPLGYNWLWQVYVRDHLDNPEYELIQARSYDNAFLDKGVVDNFAADYHGDFYRQEIGGEFVQFVGLVYPGFDHAKHISTERPGGGRVVVGVDWGYANPGVFLVARIDGDGKVWILEEVYESGRDMDWWAAAALHIKQKYGASDFACDPSEPQFIHRLRDEAGVEARGADNAVNPGINAVTRKLAGSYDKPLLSIQPSCTNLIQEFGDYQWNEDRQGNRKEQVVKINDHCMDALRYLIHSEPALTRVSVTSWR